MDVSVVHGKPRQLTYSIITPAHNEASTLPRLAASVLAQTDAPLQWVIVENGSSDETLSVGKKLAREISFVTLISICGAESGDRGAPIVRALHEGIKVLEPQPDIVANVDADVTFEADYFERLHAAFDEDPFLGIAGGAALEHESDEWRPRFVTGGSVWGATRAFRWECLQDVLPFEPRHGWDGLDQLKARSQGWRTRTLLDLNFRHHRPEGDRDGSRWAHWRANGETAHFMGYRPSYLLLRTAHQVHRDRHALGLAWGFLVSSLRRAPQWNDRAGRALLREDQRVRNLARRRQEANGQAPASGKPLRCQRDVSS